MARVSFKYKEGDTFSSTEQSNEDVKVMEDYIYNNLGEINKLKIDTTIGFVIIGKNIIEDSLFIFEYDEEK